MTRGCLQIKTTKCHIKWFGHVNWQTGTLAKDILQRSVEGSTKKGPGKTGIANNVIALTGKNKVGLDRQRMCKWRILVAELSMGVLRLDNGL